LVSLEYLGLSVLGHLNKTATGVLLETLTYFNVFNTNSKIKKIRKRLAYV